MLLHPSVSRKIRHRRFWIVAVCYVLCSIGFFGMAMFISLTLKTGFGLLVCMIWTFAWICQIIMALAWVANLVLPKYFIKAALFLWVISFFMLPFEPYFLFFMPFTDWQMMFFTISLFALVLFSPCIMLEVHLYVFHIKPHITS